MHHIPDQVINSQPITQPLGQPLSQPILHQSVSADPTLNQPTNAFTPEGFPKDLFAHSEPIQTDFGKVKCIEVLYFKEAELERTIGSDTVLCGVGMLQVLYFKNYDRFVLSLKDWKYPLLRRVPIVCSGQACTGPFYYTLPTYNGFFTLKLTKIPNLEAFQNFEAILKTNGKLSYHGTQSVLKREPSPDDRYREHKDVFDGSIQQQHEVPVQSEVGQPSLLTTKDKFKRGFQKVASKLTRGMSRKGKHNLNLYQLRDIDSIKRTSEITVPFYFYPKREVERWIAYSKEIASRNNFEPELSTENTLNESERLKSYGSTDLGQGYLSDPLSSKILTSGITCDRPEGLHLYSSTTGTVAAGHGHDGYSKPYFMDKVKAKLPGTHHYHGEKLEGHTFGDFSNQRNSSIVDKMKTKLTGHSDYPHQGLANPTGAAVVSLQESAIKHETIDQSVSQITKGIQPMNTSTSVLPSQLLGNVVREEPHHSSLKDKVMDEVTGHKFNRDREGNIESQRVPEGLSTGRREEIHSSNYHPSTHVPKQNLGEIREQQYFSADQA